MAPARGTSGRLPAERRIFSLVLALVASPQGLTKRELLSTVHGYAERTRHGESDPALDRLFDRDKEHLRELGIPLEAVDSPEAPGDNRLTRYRISKQRLQMPEDLRFTAREIALLRLAALAWAEGALTAESRRSAMKIEALGAGLDALHLGIAPRIGSTDTAAPALQTAIEAGRVVRFAYQHPDRDAPLARRVAPLRLHRAEGRWHLLAYDLERDGDRVFLLSRIVGPVRIDDDEAPADAFGRAPGIIDGLEEVQRRQRVAVLVRPGTVAEARLGARGTAETADGGWERVEFGTLDYRELAIELAGYGEEISVVHPEALREQVRDRWVAVRRQHGRSDAEGDGHGA